MLEQVESDLNGEIPWTVKLVEKAGIPLRNLFLPKFPLVEGCVIGDKCKACEGDGISCRPKSVVYRAECRLCPTGSDLDRTYVGETSRVFRKRVLEHMTALDRMDPKSFQVLHWFKQHKDDLEPPPFKFKIIGAFKDALSRQLTEAIHIQDSGELNKKCEFRINELCRLVPKLSNKDSEEIRIGDIKDKENERIELNKFIINKTLERGDHSSMTNTEINYYRKRQLPDIDPVRDSKRNKRFKVMEASTPTSWRARLQESPEGIIGITPIKPVNHSPDLVPPELEEFDDDAISPTVDKGRTNNSNELRVPLLGPRKLETEEEEELSLVKETEMLARSSTSNLCSIKLEENTNIDPVQGNYFFGNGYMRERTRSLDSLLGDMDLNQLSDWSGDSLIKGLERGSHVYMDSSVVIGQGADTAILSLPATPSTPSAVKRALSPDKKTPRGRPRKLSTAVMNSPILRKNLVTIIPDN